MTIYERLKAAGCELSAWQSDLYVKFTPEARKIIAEYNAAKVIPGYPPQEGTALGEKIFTADDGSGIWFEIPFAYDPFWPKNTGIQMPEGA